MCLMNESFPTASCLLGGQHMTHRSFEKSRKHCGRVKSNQAIGCITVFESENVSCYVLSSGNSLHCVDCPSEHVSCSAWRWMRKQLLSTFLMITLIRSLKALPLDKCLRKLGM